MDELPLDILFNILLRIPVKLLLQLRSVSKQWCKLIDSPVLANLHARKGGVEEPTVLLLSDPTHKSNTMDVHVVRGCCKVLRVMESPITRFDLNYSYLEGSCNGLFYFAANGNNSEGVILLNPLRKGYQKLATERSQWPNLTKYGLGFDCSSQSYKIVRVFFEGLDWKSFSYNLGAQVYSFRTRSWKDVHKLPSYPIRGKAIFAYGGLHWMVNPLFAGNNMKNMIVSFDIKKEQFNSTPHPDFLSKECKLFQLVDLNGNLGMVDLSYDTNIDIWLLKDWLRKKWVKEYRIHIRPPVGRTDNRDVEVIGPWGHDEILLTSFGQCFVYNPETNMLSGYSQALHSDSTICSYKGSLMSISEAMAV